MQVVFSLFQRGSKPLESILACVFEGLTPKAPLLYYKRENHWIPALEHAIARQGEHRHYVRQVQERCKCFLLKANLAQAVRDLVLFASQMHCGCLSLSHCLRGGDSILEDHSPIRVHAIIKSIECCVSAPSSGDSALSATMSSLHQKKSHGG